MQPELTSAESVNLGHRVEMDVGQRIKAARQRIGWSQQRLGDLVGVSKSAVSQWESGTTGQLQANLRRAAMALGIPLSELFGEKEAGALLVHDPKELAILELFRGLDDEGRERTLGFLYHVVGRKRGSDDTHVIDFRRRPKPKK